MAATLTVAQQDTTLHARARSHLSAGELKPARRLLDAHLQDHPRDAEALTLLGRVHLAWPVIGRYRAWELLERAARLDPANPEPRYWQMRVGLHLGSADGERLARDALFQVWALDPDYRDTWDAWPQIYHGNGQLRRAIAILSRHAGERLVDLRRAQLLIEASCYAAADSVLADVVARGEASGSAWALRAQGALEASDTVAGLEYYRRALRQADTDVLEVLWQQVQGIATPTEERRYNAIPPGARGGFLRAFWGRREPDLTTQHNDRVPEHFRRLRAAREQYRLLHPQSGYHRAPERRTLARAIAPDVLLARRGFGPDGGPLPGQPESATLSADAGPHSGAASESSDLTRHRRLGLDGRGLLFLRHGDPVRRYTTPGGDVEVWNYHVGGRPVTVTFARATAAARFAQGGTLFGGDLVVYPTSAAERHNSTLMLESDHSGLRSELTVHAWVAAFRGARRGEQRVYVGATPPTTAAAVWGQGWQELARSAGRAPHVFTLTPGRYQLGVDARVQQRFGRLREAYTVPPLWRDGLRLSSLLAGNVSDTAFGRTEAAAAMPGDRRMPAGAPLGMYAEVYGLSADERGLASFTVEYRIEPEHGNRPVTLRFARQVPHHPTIVERVTLVAGEVPPGRYRITLTVQDEHTGAASASSSVRVILY